MTLIFVMKDLHRFCPNIHILTPCWLRSLIITKKKEESVLEEAGTGFIDEHASFLYHLKHHVHMR